jgi:hypothetical protein
MGGFRVGSMARWIMGLGSPGLCSEMSLPSLWRDCMKKSLYGVSTEEVLKGFRRFMVVFMGPYSCLFWRMCKMYPDCGLLFLMYLACSW